MENKPILVDYRNSGVKTLRGLSVVFYALSLLITFVGFILALLEYFDDKVPLIFNFLFIALGCLAMGGIMQGISTIANAALYQKAVIESKYETNQSKNTASNQEFDYLIKGAAALVVELQDCSDGLFQARLFVSPKREKRMIDQLLRLGVIGATEDNQRVILIQDKEKLEEILNTILQ